MAHVTGVAARKDGTLEPSSDRDLVKMTIYTGFHIDLLVHQGRGSPTKQEQLRVCVCVRCFLITAASHQVLSVGQEVLYER